MMNPSKDRKPSLPRLTTDLPPRRQTQAVHPLLAIKALQDTNVQEPKLEKLAAAPTLFGEDSENDENVAPAVRYAPTEAKTIYVAQKSVEDSPLTKTKTLYYEDAFTARGSHNSPKDRVAQDSLVVAELKTNFRVRMRPAG